MKIRKVKYEDQKGYFKLDPLHAKSGSESSIYEYVFKNGIKWKPPSGTYPRYSKETLEKFEEEGRLVFPGEYLKLANKDKEIPYKGKKVMAKRYLHEVYEGKKVESYWDGKEVGFNKDTTQEFENLFNFTY